MKNISGKALQSGCIGAVLLSASFAVTAQPDRVRDAADIYGRDYRSGRGGGVYRPYGGYGGEPQRAGRWEVALGGRYSSYDSIRFNSDITLVPEDSFGFDFSIGYNFDPYLNLSFELFGDNANYSSTVDNGDGSFGSIDGSMDTSTGQLNLTYHWFDSAVTPFVAAGIGWTYIDSNIIRGYAGTACWYHPWYGYVCDDVYDTYNDTALSYNAAIGMRFDLSDSFFVRASAGRQWIYFDQTSTHPAVDFGKVELGFMF